LLATILLIGMVILGYYNFSPWILLPSALLAAFIGIHYPSGKAELAKERGTYWQVLIFSIPLQAVILAILFGIGWGVHVFVS